ncbi:hypothetical protein BM1_04257 [Bipolaris maydis]|nr:hypothetical protein BM1_04257 [Bipolaris maydis]
MLIHFETRNRLRITISSRHHDVGEQTTGTAVHPFASDSASLSSGNERTPSTNPASLPYPKDPLEEDFPVLNRNQNVRRRSRLLRFCRFLIKIRRMYPQTHSVVDDDPPPAYMPYIQDCHSSSVQELPTDRVISELPAEPRPLELESPTDQTPDLARHTSQVPVGHTYHGRYRTTEHAELQGPSRAETSRSLWGSDAVLYPSSVPGSTIHQQFHKPLPISPPKTPDTHNDSGTQLGPGTELHRGVLFPDVYSPPNDHQDEFNMPILDLNYAFQHGNASHMNINHVEIPLFSAPIPPAGCQQSRRDSHPHYDSSSYPNAAEPYNAQSNASITANSSVDNPWVPSYGMTSIPLGVYDFDESRGWQYHNGYGQKTNNPNAFGYSTKEVDTSYTFAKLDDRQHYEVHEGSCSDAEENDESLSCSQCSTLFHGKYRNGNLRRHIRAFHSVVASVLGLTCRMCEKQFKRADATRKHEWEQHSMPDVKPRKRTPK